MKEIHGEAAVFEVISENVRIVILLSRSDALFLLELVHGGELIAQAGRSFKLLSLGSSHHARRERALQLRVPALEKSCASRTACS